MCSAVLLVPRAYIAYLMQIILYMFYLKEVTTEAGNETAAGLLLHNDFFFANEVGPTARGVSKSKSVVFEL